MKMSMLYPCMNECRNYTILDGTWKMRFDPEERGEKENWQVRLPDAFPIPVPASFADLFTEKEKREYCGDFWYETDFWLDNDVSRDVILRFGSVTHRASVYVNGKKAGFHEGGFLPFVLDITAYVSFGAYNRITVKANNELNETSIPCGAVKVMKDGRKIAKPYFDFYNYSGIQRSVHLVRVPKETILDYDTSFVIGDQEALVNYAVYTNGEHPVEAELYDRDGNKAAACAGREGTLKVSDPRLWEPGNPYLYTIVFRIIGTDGIIDKYAAPLGIRSVEIRGRKILINGKEVYLRGYGKHEDFEVIGRTFSRPVAKRDFELMKWSNANCFRTSHYPYAEEWYQMADEEGIMIIDEVPAVGMMRSLVNFVKAGTGGADTRFFMAPTVPELQKNHKAAVEDMVIRDKNHPSVIAFSIFNEPETTYQAAYDYFAPLFETARMLDPQKRPLTGAIEASSAPEKDLTHPLCDFISMNRYYGWYILGGAEISDAEERFRDEMDRWAGICENKPMVFTEFGADTSSAEHKLPSVMWSQEYQNEYYEMNFRVMDEYDFVQGELVWNFADFQTTEGIMRVNGNKKGIFTRNRQPKDAAFLLKGRWQKK